MQGLRLMACAANLNFNTARIEPCDVSCGHRRVEVLSFGKQCSSTGLKPLRKVFRFGMDLPSTATFTDRVIELLYFLSMPDGNFQIATG